jgi:single-strand DNA-binding protein
LYKVNNKTWGKLAESCSNIGRKGRGVRIVGRLKQDRWTDTESKNHSRISVVAEHVEFKPDFTKKLELELALPAEGEDEEAAAAVGA